MRLICPNCGAQYEIPDDVIPPAGRDVQCSNCGHTWFEQPGASVAAEVGAAPAQSLPSNATEAARRPEPAAPGPVNPPAPREPVARTETAPEPKAENPGLDDLPDRIADEEAPALAETPAPDADALAAIAAMVRSQDQPTRAAAQQQQMSPQVQRRGLDPSVADILREEAALEDQRRKSTGGLESQPDLGIDAPIDPDRQRAEEARRRLALLKGEAPNPQPATRRERLPDIEEINSTLRATSERKDAAHIEEADIAPRRKRGFRTGFRLMVLLALLGLILYVAAPRLSSAVPALAPALSGYVATVDRGRLWLDSRMQQVLEGLTSGEADVAEPVATGS